jgi:hypothetical protein
MTHSATPGVPGRPFDALQEIRARREAAHSMRECHPVSHPRHEMWFTLSTLLDLDARDIQNPKRYLASPTISAQHEALSSTIGTVARAYLAAVDRPDISEEL